MSAAQFFLAYLFLISVVAVTLTAADKHAARRGKRRIPEELLLTVGFLGGALAEYITMKLIRHKTKHKRFMVGLPLTVLFHIALTVFVFVYA